MAQEQALGHTMNDSEDSEGAGRLRDAEIAIIDTLKILLEFIMATGIAKPSLLDKMLDQQSRAYLQKQMPDALVVIELLRQYVSDPQRAAHREEFRKILGEPPLGSA